MSRVVVGLVKQTMTFPRIHRPTRVPSQTTDKPTCWISGTNLSTFGVVADVDDLAAGDVPRGGGPGEADDDPSNH